MVTLLTQHTRHSSIISSTAAYMRLSASSPSLPTSFDFGDEDEDEGKVRDAADEDNNEDEDDDEVMSGVHSFDCRETEFGAQSCEHGGVDTNDEDLG